jgi:hypothetical protein
MLFTDAFATQSYARKMQTPMESERNALPRKAHIENRRLCNLALGRLSLCDWEQDHLQTCEICQGVFYVLLIAEDMSGSKQKKADDAA